MGTYSLIGNSSELEEVLPHIIELDNNTEYEIGLISLWAYNAIPNIETNVNNRIGLGSHVVELEEGSYEIDDICSAIKKQLNGWGDDDFILKANNNTLKCEIRSKKDPIDLSIGNSMASLLGFDKEILAPNKWHYSKKPISIIRVNSIRVECNLARGTFRNGIEGHTIHEFYPNVPPGFMFLEQPTSIIYVPINTNQIQTISIRLVDQDGRLINFRNEIITVRINIRRKRRID